jgi:VanZ family protein
MLKLGMRLSMLLALLAMLLLIVALYLPQTAMQAKQLERALGGDAVLHVLVGALLPLTLGVLLRIYRLSWQRQAIYWCGCLLLFALDELAQGLSPLRAPAAIDFALSALGWLISSSGWTLWLSIRGRLR